MWRIFTSNPRILWALISLYHFVIGFFAYRYALNHVADANKYWFRRGNTEKILEEIHWPLREHLLFAVNYVMAVQWSFPFWLGFLLYSSIGLLGIYFLYKSILNLQGILSLHPLFLLVLMLPSMHFWTSIIGKEPLVFLGIAMAFYALRKTQIQYSYLLIGLLIMGVIRPQMAGIFVFCLGLAFLFHHQKFTWKHWGLFALVAIMVVLGLSKASWFRSFSWEAIQYYIDVHHWQLSKSKAYVPLEEYAWPYKLFTFYFRPLPGEMSGTLGWLQGLENLFLLLLSGFGAFAFFKIRKKLRYSLSLLETCILLFSLVTAIVLSLAYSNFGLISRMKNMFMPFMLMLFIHWIVLYLNTLYDAKRKTD